MIRHLVWIYHLVFQHLTHDAGKELVQLMKKCQRKGLDLIVWEYKSKAYLKKDNSTTILKNLGLSFQRQL